MISQNSGYHFEVLGSILGSPHFRKLPSMHCVIVCASCHEMSQAILIGASQPEEIPMNLLPREEQKADNRASNEQRIISTEAMPLGTFTILEAV